MMLQRVLIEKILKLVTTSLAKKFKLSKLLRYMERPNECDLRVEQLEEDVKELKKMAHSSKGLSEIVDKDIWDEYHKSGTNWKTTILNINRNFLKEKVSKEESERQKEELKKITQGIFTNVKEV